MLNYFCQGIWSIYIKTDFIHTGYMTPIVRFIVFWTVFQARAVVVVFFVQRVSHGLRGGKDLFADSLAAAFSFGVVFVFFPHRGRQISLAWDVCFMGI